MLHLHNKIVSYARGSTFQYLQASCLIEIVIVSRSCYPLKKKKMEYYRDWCSVVFGILKLGVSTRDNSNFMHWDLSFSE